MRRMRHANGFTALRVEGGILPPEFLQAVASQAAKHQSGPDYGLSRSLNLKDELSRYWRIANDLWATYLDLRQRAGADPSRAGVNHWLLPLLRDVLGYQDLTPCRPTAVADRRFPITHQAFGGTVPLVLTTREYELDRADSRFGEDGRRRSPHDLMQEYLNAETKCQWGLVANGNRLRLVRDNPSLTKSAFVEADLELIFSEQLYSDFTAFWLAVQSSRLRPVDGDPDACILEQWRQTAHETGQRALEHLRDGVTDALRQLGNGFLQHPRNEDLRSAIAAGDVSAHAFFQELLRLVYRLLFLFRVEERGLLHTPSTSAGQRRIYHEGYSLARLRDRAARRRHYDHHDDLWRSLLIVFRSLARGAKPLGLAALGGLFSEDQCPTLDAAQLPNARLLDAVRSLSFFRNQDGLARINYRDMDTEELGSVYESLLELHPRMDVEARPWEFGFVSDNDANGNRGSDRKLTGSYYTPSSLVNELIKSALEPVMAEAMHQHPDNPRAAILDLKVIDPACGSGHFLLAAARRMAAEIARLDAVADTPDEDLRQHALREVVRHSIYGVDRNPLAVELCRAALWMETVEPGKPLTFLHSHIQCGDSLVGVFDPQMMEDGIPDEAYKPLTGDDPAVCRELKRRNRQSLSSVQMRLFDADVYKEVAASSSGLETLPEDTIADIEAKRNAWHAVQADELWQAEALRANLYAAAYFAPKTAATMDRVPITEDLNRVRLRMAPRLGLRETATDLADRHRFIHWYLAFPEVMGRGGFDVALGNPPWERIKLQEQEFFASRSPEIAQAPNKAERETLINALSLPDAMPAERALFREFRIACREAEAASQCTRTSGRYPMTAVGDVNTYAVFSELFLSLLSPRGRAGLIVQSGIATDNSTKAFFEYITGTGRLISFFDMVNLEGIFPGIHRTHPHFCLMTLGPALDGRLAVLSFYNTNTHHLQDERRKFSLSKQDFELLNPNTKTCPVFRSNADAELTRKIYSRVPVLIDEARGAKGNPWGISFMTMFHMSNDSGMFRTFRQLGDAGACFEGTRWVGRAGRVWVPLYEGKMIHQFDHRWATFEENEIDSRDVSEAEKRQYDFEPLARYWVPQAEVESQLGNRGWKRQWLMGWRDITNATNERTTIASVLPRVGVGNNLPLFFPGCEIPPEKIAAILGNFSTLVLDFHARHKVGGTHLNFFLIEQLAVLPPERYSRQDLNFIVPRVLELTYSSQEIRPFAVDLGYEGPPFVWEPDRRARIRSELDAYYAYLYGLTRDELRYILDPSDVYGSDYPSETFRVLKSTELKEFGEYRTQRLVLEAWERLASSELISQE